MFFSTGSVVDGFRGPLQDILIPEREALGVPLNSMRIEMQLRDEKMKIGLLVTVRERQTDLKADLRATVGDHERLWSRELAVSISSSTISR